LEENFFLSTDSSWDATEDLAFNSALAMSNFEETLLTPVLAPRVSTNPILLSIFFTVADEFNGMTSKLCTSNVLVDSFLVAHEIFIDGVTDL
jgi:hypothetical protein